jgi:hypothetical protein
MKKIVFILMAAFCLMLVKAETFVAFGASKVDSAIRSARDESDDRNRSEANASENSLCREVDVPLDEGYGVSRHEKRLVCQEIH